MEQPTATTSGSFELLPDLDPGLGLAFDLHRGSLDLHLWGLDLHARGGLRTAVDLGLGPGRDASASLRLDADPRLDVGDRDLDLGFDVGDGDLELRLGVDRGLGDGD